LRETPEQKGQVTLRGRLQTSYINSYQSIYRPFFSSDIPCGAANHHDSLFLKPLIKLAQAMGIDVKLITADQAYHDSDGSVLQETGVYVVAPASEKSGENLTNQNNTKPEKHIIEK
jgi:hypothetical protein